MISLMMDSTIILRLLIVMNLSMTCARLSLNKSHLLPFFIISSRWLFRIVSFTLELSRLNSICFNG